MDEGLDYNVQAKINFILNFDNENALNTVDFPTVYRQFAEHVRKVYKRNKPICEHISGNLKFKFDGPHVILEYTLSCHFDHAAQAGNFSAYCLQRIRYQLEEFGCEINKVSYEIREADIPWVNQMEVALFDTKDSIQKQPPSADKGGKKTASQKKSARQER